MAANKLKKHNQEFPKSFNDFYHLGREIKKEELITADKEGLIELCCALKLKELRYDIERNEANNLIVELLELLEEDKISVPDNVREKLTTFFN